MNPNGSVYDNLIDKSADQIEIDKACSLARIADAIENISNMLGNVVNANDCVLRVENVP